MRRKQEKDVLSDLSEKYVFLGGPRQSGKTTLSKQLISDSKYQYLNYDLSSDRKIMTQGHWDRTKKLIILDEFHKFPKWKTFIKGYYDTDGPKPSVLVTGSAKLNIFKKGNDSMVGRYYYHRLLPLSVKELATELQSKEATSQLLTYGNFPEPLLSQSVRKAKRWKEHYLERVIREDVTDLSNVRNLPKIQLLIDLLRDRVGSSISYASLARDLEMAAKTVKEWVDLLEELYIVFRVTPFHKNIARAILKEPKIYFFDCTMAFNQEAHLENLVAVSLLKHLWYLEDTEGEKSSLHYLRTKDGKEIDFLTVTDRQPQDLIEVKTTDSNLSSAFPHFQKFINVKQKYQLVHNINKSKTILDVQICSVESYLTNLSI